jgi:hypothetical protein
MLKRSVPKFRAPNQRPPETAEDLRKQKVLEKQRIKPLKTRPFDAKFKAPKFTKSPFVKKNQELEELALKLKKKKTAEKKAKSLEKNAFKIENELLAFYFMELAPDQQDDLLVEHAIIVPDAIRNDLEKMCDFILKNRADGIDFVPMKTILSLLLENQNKI